MEQENGKYQICGPTAFNFYNLDNQIPTVTYVYNNRISGSRMIANLSFQFIKTADKRLGATHIARSREGAEAIYSSKARTLMDAVYDWSRFNSLPEGYAWIRQEIKKDFKLGSELVETTAMYGNQATTRRIGFLLDSFVQHSEIINRLQGRLNKSKSLIPWIPGKPAKGTVNRKWGVIVNE
jgi:predicted transcriptional regulator of viral defense system